MEILFCKLKIQHFLVHRIFFHLLPSSSGVFCLYDNSPNETINNYKRFIKRWFDIYTDENPTSVEDILSFIYPNTVLNVNYICLINSLLKCC